jgi:hypothetical protein
MMLVWTDGRQTCHKFATVRELFRKREVLFELDMEVG